MKYIYYKLIFRNSEGGARGADSLAERYAEDNEHPINVYEPDWDLHGKKAGFLRNTTIVRNCDFLIAFWDGKSHGTSDSIEKAKEMKKFMAVVSYEN